jgi:hypothetical protein
VHHGADRDRAGEAPVATTSAPLQRIGEHARSQERGRDVSARSPAAPDPRAPTSRRAVRDEAHTCAAARSRPLGGPSAGGACRLARDDELAVIFLGYMLTPAEATIAGRRASKPDARRRSRGDAPCAREREPRRRTTLLAVRRCRADGGPSRPPGPPRERFAGRGSDGRASRIGSSRAGRRCGSSDRIGSCLTRTPGWEPHAR